MTKPKLTQWFPPDVKPVRVGWYHKSSGNTKPFGNLYQSDFNWWWNGFAWTGAENSRWPVQNQARWWRGLTEKGGDV